MEQSSKISEQTIQNLSDMAHKLRIHSIEMTDVSNSGHPTSCSSIAELLSVIFFHESGMNFYAKDPHNASNDKFILSKGHAAPIYYAAWAEAGNFPTTQLLDLRKVTSDLEGHPTPRLSFCDVATGSLGQGLGFACGAAYSSKHIDEINNKYFCILGDGECAEGSVWEAASFASFYKLDNLVAIVDANRLGQSAPTMIEHDTDIYARRFNAFGWHTISVDGHNVEEIINAFQEARRTPNQPTAIIAKTYKGKYFTEDIENKLNWHGKAIVPKSQAVKDHIRTLMKNTNIELKPFEPQVNVEFRVAPKDVNFKVTSAYDMKKQVSTREAYGNALKKLGDQDENNHIMALDCDVKNSTGAETLEKAHPKKFINCFIAEQNMVSVALGVSKRNKIAFCSTFGAFYSRAFDQIRMGAISFGNVKFFGSHSGVNIGQDGPSQMALEDLSMFRTIPNALVLCPSDAVSTEKAVEIAANYNGIVYIKGGRSNHPILYDNSTQFQIGEAKILRSSDKDVLTVISGGATIFECLKAQEDLAKEGVNVRVVDIFSVKPVDQKTLLRCAEETNGRFFVVEDHYPEGGIGEAVMNALKEVKNVTVHHRAVNDIPRSGTPEELYDLFGLSASKLFNEIKSLLA